LFKRIVEIDFKVKGKEVKKDGNPHRPKQIVFFEELLMSQVVQQEALTRLLMEKGIFSKEEFWEMVRVVDREMKRKRKREL